MAYELKFPDKIKKSIDNNKIIEQKAWTFIKELNSFDDEHLDSVALVDNYREYTYRQMFRRWEQYAEVFSALGITEENNSCVGLLPDLSAEAIFSLYALNMTGATVSMIHFFDFLEAGRWDKMIKKEGITDLVLYEKKITPDLLNKIVSSKEELGIRNIIILHSTGKNTHEIADAAAFRKMNYMSLKKIHGVLFMPDLLKKYEAMPISYGSKESKEVAVVMHTSGTTNGIHKPIPISDRGMNESAARMLRCDMFQKFKKRIVTVLAMEPTAAYALMDMINLPFAFGGCVIIPHASGPMLGHDLMVIIKKYKVNVLFSSGHAFSMAEKIPFNLDLSSLEFVFLGGSYVSRELRKKANDFLKKNGSSARVSIGYGATETCGACVLSSPDKDDDAIGVPLPGVKVKIFNENDEKYYNLEDGPSKGVLFISSPSVSGGKLNDIEFFKLEEIDGEKYLNTFDLVRVNEDGTLNCIGRMNKYFVNNEGIRFDAGLVETAISAEKGISACALAPQYDKMLHDTVPVLYVQTTQSGDRALEILRKALLNVFIKDNIFEKSNVPGICVISDNLPLNEAGKVDVYQIIEKGVDGEKYSVKVVKRNDIAVDIKMKAYINGPGRMLVVPDELEADGKMIKNFFKRNRNNGNSPRFNAMPGHGINGHNMNGHFMHGEPCEEQVMPEFAMPCKFMPGGIDFGTIMQFIQSIALQQGYNINHMYEQEQNQHRVQPGMGYQQMPYADMCNQKMPGAFMGFHQTPQSYMDNQYMSQPCMGCQSMPMSMLGGCMGNQPMQNPGMGYSSMPQSVMGYHEMQNPGMGHTQMSGNQQGGFENNGGICNIMRYFFNASDSDEYYED